MQKEYLDFLSLIISILSFIISFFTCFITVRTYNAQFKQIKNQELPNLKILSIVSNKSESNDSKALSENKYCRIIKNSGTDKNEMAVFTSDDEEIENGFIYEIESHIGKNNVYFTYFNQNPFLVINHASDKKKYVVDHCNVIISLHNYGATISALSIESFTAYYKASKDIEKIFFRGNIDKKITLSPNENENFILCFDEVTTNFENCLCHTDSEDYNELPESIDILRIHMPENSFSYDKLEIKFHCWDLFNNETVSTITIEYNGNFFISTTSIET